MDTLFTVLLALFWFLLVPAAVVLVVALILTSTRGGPE